MSTFYYKSHICKKCGGSCCKRVPPFVFPKDVLIHYPKKNLTQAVLRALDSGNWQIDWWEDETKRYYLRLAVDYKKMSNTGQGIAHKVMVDYYRERFDRVFDGTWGGYCIFWDEKKGCKLLPSKRPFMCKVMNPNEDFKNCRTDKKYKMEKLDYARAWEKSNVDLLNLGTIADNI